MTICHTLPTYPLAEILLGALLLSCVAFSALRGADWLASAFTSLRTWE